MAYNRNSNIVTFEGENKEYFVLTIKGGEKAIKKIEKVSIYIFPGRFQGKIVILALFYEHGWIIFYSVSQIKQKIFLVCFKGYV